MKTRRFNILNKDLNEISNSDKEEEEKLVNNLEGIMKPIDILKLNNKFRNKLTVVSNMNQK